MFDLFNQDILKQWERLPFLELTFPRVLDHEPIEPLVVLDDLLHQLVRPRTLGEMAEAYAAAGEFAAVRRILPQLDRTTSQKIELRYEAETRRYQEKIEQVRPRLLGMVRQLEVLGLKSGPWQAEFERSRRLESHNRLGPTLHVLEQALGALSAWKEERFRQLAAEVQQMRKTAIVASVTPRQAELLEAAETFLARKDLLNAADAVRATKNMGSGPEAPEVAQLIARARARDETDLFRSLPADLEALPSLREVQLLIRACAVETPAPDVVPRDFVQAWSALPVDTQFRPRQNFVTNAAQLIEGTASASVRERALKDLFRAMENLGDVLIDKQQKLRLIRGEEVTATEITFKNPWFGPVDIQDRKPISLYVVVAPESSATLQVVQNDLAARGNEDRLAMIMCLRRSPELQSLARQTRRPLAVLDSASLLRMVLSRNTSKALFREVMQQLDLSTISPYRPLDVVTGYMFRGRTAEIQRFVNNVTSVIVYGGRMMGKSSLLHRTAQELEQRGWVTVERSCEPLRDPRTRVIEPISLCEYLLRGLTGFRGQLQQPREFVDLVAAWLDEDRQRKVAFFVDEVDDLLESDRHQGFAVCGAFKELAHQRYPTRLRFFFAGFKKLYDATMAETRPLTRFASDYKIEPLDEQSANELIREPLELMGIQFEEGQEQTLLAQIHNFTSNHPSLVQKFCQLIVEKMISRRTGPPYWLNTFDVSEVFKSDAYREYVRFTLVKNYEPIQELIVCLAVSDQQLAASGEDTAVRFSAKRVRSLLLEWLQEKQWSEYLTVQRIDVWLQELKAMRVLDVEDNKDYRFSLSVYPRILADTSNIEERIIELVSGISRKSPAELERPGTERARPTTLHDLSLMLRDKQRHHVLIGLPGCGGTKSIEELYEVLEAEAREILLMYPDKTSTFGQFIKEAAEQLLPENVPRTELQIQKEISRRASQNGKPLVLLVDGLAFAARPKEAERFLQFFASFRAPQREFVWLFLTGGIDLWRNFELFRSAHPQEAQSYRVTFLGRFRSKDTQNKAAPVLPEGSSHHGPELLDRLHVVSGGHPLVLEHLLARMQKAGPSESLALIIDRFQRDLAQAPTVLPDLWKRTIEVFDKRSAEVLRLLIDSAQRGASIDELAQHLVADPKYAGRTRLREALRAELEPLVQMEQVHERAGRYQIPDEDPIGIMLRATPLDADFLLRELVP